MDFAHLEDEYTARLEKLWNEQGKGNYDTLAECVESTEFAESDFLRDLENEIQRDLESRVEDFAAETLESIVMELDDRLKTDEEE